jgi:prepilin peptidase CpaA
VLAILGAFLLAAAWIDLRRQCIPNRLVFAGTALALLLHTLLPVGDGFLSALPGGLGLIGSLKGLLFGLLAFLPLYALRTMAAGDVKLVAMVGAFLGPVDIWFALLCTLLAGGVLVIVVGLYRGVLGKVWSNLRLMFWNAVFTFNTPGLRTHTEGSGPLFISAATLPYGVSIALGCIASVLYRAQQVGLI